MPTRPSPKEFGALDLAELAGIETPNPNPDVGTQRVTGIGGATRRTDELEGLMTYSSSFRVGPDDARKILREVLEATADWRRIATGNGVSAGGLSLFVDAFDGLRDPLERLAG